MKKIKTAITHSALVLLVSTALFSCTGGKKAATTTNTDFSKRKIACENIPIQDGEPVVRWYKSDLKGADITAAIPLPASYDLYEIDSTELLNFLRFAAKSDHYISINFPLPTYLKCQPFTVATTGTATEISGKHPEVFSLKGTSPNNTITDIRLNYGNGQMNATIGWEKMHFRLMPVTAQGRTLYMIYEEDNSVGPQRVTDERLLIPEIRKVQSDHKVMDK